MGNYIVLQIRIHVNIAVVLHKKTNTQCCFQKNIMILVNQQDIHVNLSVFN